MQLDKVKSSIPEELTKRNQWVLWKIENIVNKKTGQPEYCKKTGEIQQTKVPYQINGMKADSTSSLTWTSYKNVISRVNNYSGIGFVLIEADPYTVIDLDNCIINGKIEPTAKTIIKSLNSYTEVSQSGNGIHIFLKGEKIGDRSRNAEKEIEIYDNKHFIAITGNHLEGTPNKINKNQEALEFIYDVSFPKEEKKPNKRIKKSPKMTNKEVIHIATHAKNSKKFRALYDGKISAYGSHSEADLALCSILAYYTQDVEQIDSIFSESGLYRKKWDRKDYKTNTIEKAINNLMTTYQKKRFKLNSNKAKSPRLILTEKNTVRKLLRNLKEILRCDPKLKNIGFNEFTQEVTINKEPITDDFISKIRYRIDSDYLITFTKDDVIDMLGLLARERNSYHPIKAVIEAKAWDGQARAETVFIDYLGADDNDYTRSITKKWLSGAVARIYKPGIKMEIVPVLQGKQGIGKSTIAGRLGKNSFVDSLASLGNTKDDYQMLIGSWIVELSELSSVGSTKVEKMKGFISAQFDKIRLPYARVTQNYKRTCVFIGTTNTTQFLNDLTGNRRFFPIPLESKPAKDVFNLDDDTVQQIWAEAYQLYKNGEKLFLNNDDEEIAELYRQEAMEENLFYQEIENYLRMKVPKSWNNLEPNEKMSHYTNLKHLGRQSGIDAIDRTTSKEIAYILNLDPTSRAAQGQLKKINLYMDNLDGWERKTVRINGKPVQGYKKA